MGSCALAPPRTSTDFAGIVEDYGLASNVRIASIALFDDVETCDSDGFLDEGEVGRVVVTLANGGAMDGETTLTVGGDARFVFGSPTRSVTVPAFGFVQATFEVELAEGAPTGALLDLTVEALTEDDCLGTQLVEAHARVHVDVREDAATATDFRAGAAEFHVTGEHATTAWALSLDADVDEAFVRGWNLPTVTDTALVTPPLVASATEPLVIGFDHRFSFEADGSIYWDGAVVEYSTDGGATYQDVSTLAAPGYNAELQDFVTAGNALSGRNAYGGTNASYPNLERVTLDFGTALAGETVRLRFRIGTDEAVGDEGWTITTIEATGITNLPFAALVDDEGCDAPSPGTGGGGGAIDGGVGPVPDGGDAPGGGGGGCGCHAAGSDGASGALAPLLLMLIARRRRR